MWEKVVYLMVVVSLLYLNHDLIESDKTQGGQEEDEEKSW